MTESIILISPTIAELCRESGCEPWQVEEKCDLLADMESDSLCLHAAKDAGIAHTPIAERVIALADGGDVAAILALRRMFGLRPIV